MGRVPDAIIVGVSIWIVGVIVSYDAIIPLVSSRIIGVVGIVNKDILIEGVVVGK
jgi:hypothetical protein